ncbi:hypothetical protein HNQ51_003029 [Inhella inkyongensis]|uniref:TraB/GumN family protein n=1 Tax=Inhella inkyongensis TaxID=392593 RepID=A0A840S7W8_9BURK|nr:TraB/GumN family protein [Inhella inkyongensis]MBB5205702.1 hypothetical protein [Inhella inkyongensis]
MRNKLLPWALGMALLLGPALLRAQDCPPVAQAPTADQIEQGQRAARDRGALWRLRKDGRQSYLFGTAHVGRLAWAFPGPKLQQALAEVEVLALEVDLSAPGTQAELAQAQAEAARLTLSAQEQARLDRQADRVCLPRQALAGLHPVMQAVTYTVMAGRRAGLDPAYGQEAMLLAWAKATGRPVVALESVGLQMRALLPREPGAARRLLQFSLASLEKGDAERSLERLGQAWAEGDLRRLADLATLCECQPAAEELALHRRLNDARNPHLAERIAAEHAKGRPLLAAVGLLHMTGPQALTDLLRHQGFDVERLQ